MNVRVTVKSLGKRKAALDKQLVEVPDRTDTLRQLIQGLVEFQIQEYKKKQDGATLLRYMMPEEIEAGGAAGKVGFGVLHNDASPDVIQAAQTAITAYEDGLYKVFVNDEEISELDKTLALHEGDELVLIRFTMLAGRMW